MKKTIVLIIAALILLLSVSAVTAYDQNGTDCWCNSDADGCWVSGENGEKNYIMFWSEASCEKFMGKGCTAPVSKPF